MPPIMHLGLLNHRKLIDYHMSLLMPHALWMHPNSQVNHTTTKKYLLAIVFALDKFISYLLCSHITVFTNHEALRYLLKKPDVKPKLIRWMLHIQEFDLKIKDKSGAENMVADHLSKIEGPIDSFLIRDNFLDEHLMQLHSSYVTPWFANIVNFIVASIVPPHATRTQIYKLKSDDKYYVWDDPYFGGLVVTK